MNSPAVHSLHIYPIKSCGGISLQQVNLDKYGFENDRRWMITDINGELISQRDNPELALVRTAIDKGVLRATYKGDSIELPLNSEKEHEFYTALWGSAPFSVYDEGREAADFFSDILNCKCRLVNRSESFNRVVASGLIVGEHPVGFCDSHPLLVLTQNSLRELNHRIKEPMLSDRFRANIIIEGDLDSFAEDDWRVFEIDNKLFDFGKRCARCVVTTINQQTAEKGQEPLRELANFRRDHHTGKVWFGAYYTNRMASGHISVGSPVNIHQ
ncbi:MAG: MOSC domain-containing protein [Ignavibacteriae bacterium]|nr:MOSC domain-containing protein [Ignavibacteriota bacterium]